MVKQMKKNILMLLIIIGLLDACGYRTPNTNNTPDYPSKYPKN